MEIKNKKEVLDALAAKTKWIEVQTRDNTLQKEETELGINSLEFVDLGLPSGLLLATENVKDEDGNEALLPFDEAVEKYGEHMLTIEQWKEVIGNCTRKWDDDRKGLLLTGPNGNTVFLPAAGFRLRADVNSVGFSGNYWSGTPYSSHDDSDAYSVVFYSGYMNPRIHYFRYYGFAVRLARKPKNI